MLYIYQFIEIISSWMTFICPFISWVDVQQNIHIQKVVINIHSLKKT